MLRNFSAFVFTALFAVSVVFAQAAGRELTVEEAYLQESIEMMIIRELARAESREQKLIALDFISDAIDRGSTNDEIRVTLEHLSREGRRTIARDRGRVANNFPDVRRRAARYLGYLGTPEAHRALLEITQFENEPMVLQEAIRSLGLMGFNENNETIAHIAWVVTRFDNTVPNNLMAIAAIEAIEQLAAADGGLQSPDGIRLLARISENYRYATPVRERARMAISDLRSFTPN